MVMPLGNEAKSKVTAWATYALIAVNLLCFGLEQVKPRSFMIAYSATPYEITNNIDLANPFTHRPRPLEGDRLDPPSEVPGILVHQANGPSPIWLTLITAMFLHANLIHLAGNLLFLSIFGQRVEEAFGRLWFVGFYTGCGVVGNLAQVSFDPLSLRPILGASGAIAGIMGAYLVWFPRDRVRVLVLNFLFLVPASGVIGCWIVTQLLYRFFLPDDVAHSGGVAYLSHLGGLAVGVVTALAMRFRNPTKRRDADVSV